MFSITKKWTRDNPSISFLKMSDDGVDDEVRLHWALTYKMTNKCVSVDIQETDTVLTTTENWESETSYNEYHNDQYMIDNLFSLRDQYYAANNVIVEVIDQSTT